MHPQPPMEARAAQAEQHAAVDGCPCAGARQSVRALWGWGICTGMVTGHFIGAAASCRCSSCCPFGKLITWQSAHLRLAGSAISALQGSGQAHECTNMDEHVQDACLVLLGKGCQACSSSLRMCARWESEVCVGHPSLSG